MSRKITILFLIFQFLTAGLALAELKNLKAKGIYVSFEARDEKVEDLFRALSKEFSFNVNIPSTLASKTVTTTIRHMPLDRAIIRIFSLLNEPNYKIEYSKTGEISAVKVFTITTRKKENKKRKTYNRNRRYVRRPIRRVRRPTVYRESPVIYDDELLDDEDIYYPEDYDRQYQPRRRTPFIPSDEGR